MRITYNLTRAFIALLLLMAGNMTYAQSCPVYAAYGVGNSMDESVSAQHVDAEGHIYFTGQQQNRMMTVKLSAEGVPVWSRVLSGLTEARGKDIEVDAAGNVYVSGYTMDSANAYQLHVIKYDKNGNTLWDASYPDTTHMTWHFPLALDAQGNVYAAKVANGGNMHLVKYSSSGSLQWVKVEAPANTFYRWVNRMSLRIDQQGNVFVAGGTRSGSSFNESNFTVIKYSPSGTLLWKREDEGTMNYMDYANDMEIDAQGNLYVTGLMNYTGQYCNTVTMKYAPNGDRLWKHVYDNSSNKGDEPFDLFLSSDGHVYVTGAADHFAGGYLGITMKFDASGNLLWERELGDTLTKLVGRKIGEDVKGNIYLSGYYHHHIPYNNRYGTFAARLGSDGEVHWLDTCYKYATSYETGIISIHPAKGLYIAAGHTAEGDSTQSVAVFRYDIDALSAGGTINEDDVLSVHPNPSAGTFTLNIDPNEEICVELLDLSGRKISCASRKNEAGNITVDAANVSPGIYMVRAITPKETFSKRIVIVRE